MLSAIFLLAEGPSQNSAPLDSTVVYLERGDRVIYSKSSGMVKASGHVIVRVRNVTISTDSLLLDMKNQTISANGNILANIKGIYFIAENMTYNIKTDEGKLQKAYTYVSGLYLYAEELRKKGNLFIMKNASFTTCNANPPHYTMTASMLSMAVDEYIGGRFVAFRIGVVPVFFIPYFRYDFKMKKAFEISTGQSLYLGSYAAIYYKSRGLLPRWGVLASTSRGLAPLLEFSYRRKISLSARAFAIYEGIPWGARGRELPLRGFAGTKIVIPISARIKLIGSSFFISDRYLPLDYAPSVFGTYPKHSLHLYWAPRIGKLIVRLKAGFRRIDGWNEESQIPVSQEIPFFEATLRSGTYGLQTTTARIFKYNEIYNGYPRSLWYSYNKNRFFWNFSFKRKTFSWHSSISINNNNFYIEETLFNFVFATLKENAVLTPATSIHLDIESTQEKVLLHPEKNFPLTYQSYGDQVNIAASLKTSFSYKIKDREWIKLSWSPYSQLSETFPWKSYPKVEGGISLPKLLPTGLMSSLKISARGTYSFFWDDFEYYTISGGYKNHLELYYQKTSMYNYFPLPSLVGENEYIGGKAFLNLKPHAKVRINLRYSLTDRKLDQLSVTMERDLHCWRGVFSYDYFTKRFSFSLILVGMPAIQLKQALPLGE